MDMWLGYLWICLDISWISPVDIFSWIPLKDILFCQKISKRYLFISFHIHRYPDISNHIQRYPNGANSQMVDIHSISQDIPCISSLMDIHGISKYIPCIYHVCVAMYIPCICRTSTYTWYIPGIFQAYTENRGSRWDIEFFYPSQPETPLSESARDSPSRSRSLPDSARVP